jgi:hypothetical protein
MTDFRALCAELLLFGEQAGEIAHNESLWPECDQGPDWLLDRARAALGQQEPESLINLNDSSDSEIIRIDQHGFHYRGQFIEDAGEAHRLFVEFMRQSNEAHQVNQSESQKPSKTELRQIFDDHSGFIDDEQVMWWPDFYKAAQTLLTTK